MLNNKASDIDNAELEVGNRVALAINDRRMKIGHIIEIKSSIASNSNNKELVIKIEDSNRLVKQWSKNCCKLKTKNK